MSRGIESMAIVTVHVWKCLDGEASFWGAAVHDNADWLASTGFNKPHSGINETDAAMRCLESAYPGASSSLRFAMVPSRPFVAFGADGRLAAVDDETMVHEMDRRRADEAAHNRGELAQPKVVKVFR